MTRISTRTWAWLGAIFLAQMIACSSEDDTSSQQPDASDTSGAADTGSTSGTSGSTSGATDTGTSGATSGATDASTSGSTSGATDTGTSGSTSGATDTGTSGSTSGATDTGTSGSTSGTDADTSGSTSGATDTGSTSGTDADVIDPTDDLPPAGNPNAEATCDIPAGAGLEDISNPTTIVGTGTAASCTGEAFIAAVAAGGVITFNCGPDPVTITVTEPAKVFNNTGPKIVIDGGGLVTLSGGGTTRILYMNTCDSDQVWTTSHCNDQDHPLLTVQNITFANANSSAEAEYDGGGAIWARGGRLKIVNSRFFNNVCASEGPDLGGAAVRVFDQSQDLPVYVVNSTFGGAEGLGNSGSNGGALSSIGVSWTIINSLFSHNHAIGNGGNPSQPGTPGGGSGGAIYNDGNEMTLSLCGVRITQNEVVQHGSAIFFVSNNHTGDVRIDRSVITQNIGGSWYPTYPQISNHDDTPIVVTNSTIE
jgi:hypothetical protein